MEKNNDSDVVLDVAAVDAPLDDGLEALREEARRAYRDEELKGLGGGVDVDMPVVEDKWSVLGDSWKPITEYGYKMVTLFCNGWVFPGDEEKLLVEGGADVLTLYFPGGPRVWMRFFGPWATLLAGIGVLGMANYDRETSKLKPIRKKAPGRNADGGDGADEKRKDVERDSGSNSGPVGDGVRPEK